MTSNIRLLLHLACSVLNWGPLYENSAFAFEAGNAKLLNTVHQAKDFCLSLSTLSIQKSEKHSVARYFRISKTPISSSLTKELQLTDQARCFKKIKDCCLYLL